MADQTPTRTGSLPHGPHTLFWEYFGTGALPPVVLLNGLAMHTKAWYPFIERVAGFDVVLLDYPGQGASSSDDRAVTMPISPGACGP